MAGSVTIKELSANDSIQSQTEKLNYNFQQLATWVGGSSDPTQTIMAMVDDKLRGLKQSIDQDLSKLEEKLTKTITTKVAQIKLELDEGLRNCAPPIGSYIFLSDHYDVEGQKPSDVWPGTTWVRLGHYVVTADPRYPNDQFPGMTQYVGDVLWWRTS